MKPDTDKRVLQMVGRYTSLAMAMPLCTAVGYVIGYLLDKWLGTTWLYLPGLLVGIAAGFIQLIRTVQKDTRNGNG